jgi:hypothetical protein
MVIIVIYQIDFNMGEVNLSNAEERVKNCTYKQKFRISVYKWWWWPSLTLILLLKRRQGFPTHLHETLFGYETSRFDIKERKAVTATVRRPRHCTYTKYVQINFSRITYTGIDSEGERNSKVCLLKYSFKFSNFKYFLRSL